ncbi:phosphonate ABC transporter ATP-binding protein [Phormidium tenue FACHB-1052]|uniref:ABC transporter ATP-binding protein n=2 Tax=Phormidium tenue TaxID=126344 RepID=A0A1U7J8E2_9CYAN|nr:phosphonate ABC transporter ATP-binding protein [Phormidium tenue]MBD2231312.1 phosphonate ABC transporter ATP-binding protein [Phormidium tenue FACHB-1052]OKH49550.1 ABC transporter ATP-binding protein [Phormidium tenue NIES-30]
MVGPIFQLEGVSCRFGAVAALTDCSLSILPGERVALIGPSGAGKSTLLSLLNGSQAPTSGRVVILGQEVNRLSPKKRRRIQRLVGTVYQQHHLVGNLAVVHNVNAGHLGRWSLPRALWSLVWPQQVQTAAQALAQVGIADKLYARTDRLSGGQQQRVALARVLVQDPAAILADEPISSVDPERSRVMMDLLRQLSETTGKTLMISLHEVEFAVKYCDRIIGLRHGQILFDTPANQVSDGMMASLYQL